MRRLGLLATGRQRFSSEGVVTWDAFAHPHRPGRDYSGFGPFRFGEASYRHAAQDAADTAGA